MRNQRTSKKIHGNQVIKISPNLKMTQIGWEIHKLNFGELE
jgi:hypothetical protein